LACAPRNHRHARPSRCRRINDKRAATESASTAGSVVAQHLDELQPQGPALNRRLLDTERVGQSGVLASPAFQRIAQPTLTEDGTRTPALRFSDPRVQAPAGALYTTMLAVTGITNTSLRALMTGLLGGIDYTRLLPAAA